MGGVWDVCVRVVGCVRMCGMCVCVKGVWVCVRMCVCEGVGCV